jgi:hypothetical protein
MQAGLSVAGDSDKARRAARRSRMDGIRTGLTGMGGWSHVGGIRRDARELKLERAEKTLAALETL